MIRLRKIFYITLSLSLCILISCKEDIVAETLITGKVYDSDTNKGYDGISISSIAGRGHIIGGTSPFPVLLSYTDSLGNYEVRLTIEDEKSYTLVYRDTATVGSNCHYFSGEFRYNVDRTVSTQRFDAAVTEDSRCTN
jgi:hypothetical protein